MVDILSAPFDGGGAMLGSRLGPSALQLAGLREALDGCGVFVESWQDLSHPVPGPTVGLRSFDACYRAVEDLRAASLITMAAGRLPIVLGGEHSIAMGGISAALAHTKGDLAVLWIDAHADINVPGTSPSGSLHGMPLAALTAQRSGTDGLIDAQWLQLIHAATSEHSLLPSRIAWIGLRDVDKAEAAYITGSSGCLTLTMHDIDRRGMVAAVDKFDEWMKRCGAKNLWISFDVDVLDPILAPGTGTAVRGGLTYREGHLMAELLREKLDDGPYKLAGLDVVEVNPLEDTANSTAKIVVEWVASLFGKTILGCPAR